MRIFFLLLLSSCTTSGAYDYVKACYDGVSLASGELRFLDMTYYEKCRRLCRRKFSENRMCELTIVSKEEYDPTQDPIRK